MNRADRLISAAVLGFLPPVCLMLLFWWGSIPFAGGRERLIALLALFGLCAGAVLDFTLLRGFVFRLYSLPLPVLLAVEFVYSVLVYGFFMGFPVLNSFVGIFGAYLAARRAVLRSEKVGKVHPEISLVISFSAILLFLFCLCSAALALCEKTTGAQIKGMLHLPFDVTGGMIWALILVGGGALIVFQIFVSRRVAAWVSTKAEKTGMKSSEDGNNRAAADRCGKK